MESAPTEILINIFNFLSPKQSAKCREVCWRWKRIIDDISSNEGLWMKHCKNDFNRIYAAAHYKCMPGVNWCNIYRSLSLWAKLAQATEIRNEIALVSRYLDEIRDFQILRNGIVGVQTRGAINYYDLGSLRPAERPSISGNYTRYFENDNYIVILGLNLNLFVIRKVITNINYEANTTFGNVKAFLLANHELLYITSRDEVCLCDLENEALKSILLCQANNSIMSIGYDNKQIHLLTFQRDVYTLVDKDLVYQKTLDSSTNLLHELNNYHFLENLDWRVYFQWMYLLKHSIPQGPLRDIIVIKTYGEVVFVGSNWGVFRIYYAPYFKNQFDIFNSEPVKEYNFMDRSESSRLAKCPIIQVDVIEGINSHTILVAMPKKIAVLSYIHDFNEARAEALPYNGVENIQFNVFE